MNFLSEKSAVYALTAGYGLALFLIALVQNDFLAITFPVFRVVTVAALLLLLIFTLRLPASPKVCPQYVRKDSGLVAPKKLLTGTFVLMFVSALMGVSGPSISAEVRHGVFVTYFVDAIASTAKEYNLPVIDSYYGLGINKVNAATFLADGVHHNAVGRKRFGEFIGSCMIASF